MLAKSCKKEVKLLEQEILNLYFVEKLRQKDIAEKLKISKYKVSRTVTSDERYLAEKEVRKENTKDRHSENTKKIIKKQRDKIQFKNNSDDLILRRIHNQAAIELSKSKKLSDIAYRNWNTSAYKYNKDKKRFEFRKELGRSRDVKKYLKGTI